MKKVLVTGASGFVGSNLARRLLHEGHEVHALLRPESNRWRIRDLLLDLYIHEVSLDDFLALQPTIKQIAPEWIFHLATHGAYPDQKNCLDIMNTNIMGTVHLLEACLKLDFETFINTGSSSEYGFKNKPFSEEERCIPNSLYGISKLTATEYCRLNSESHDRNIQTLRLFSVYGPYEEPTRLIPRLIQHGLRNELPPLVTPAIARDMIYIEDVLDIYMEAASKKHQNEKNSRDAIYNVGTGIQITIEEMVNIAKKVLNISADPKWGSMMNRSFDTEFWRADIRKIKEAYHWQPRFSFEQGFIATVEWFQRNRGQNGIF